MIVKRGRVDKRRAVTWSVGDTSEYDIEDAEDELIWIKIKPSKLPRNTRAMFSVVLRDSRC